MKLINTTLTLFAAISTLYVAQAETDFEKDRKAILGMAGEFKVTFHFQETLSLDPAYTIKDKPYQEEAFEIVKVAEDSEKKIILQHILQMDGHVVKHWSHIWAYEDRELLEFKGNRAWATKEISESGAKGSWTQRVTEVTDEPRYEGYGKWIHHHGSSEWTSSLSNRPLPRREYTKRSDYDLLYVTNRHTVTPNGWYHEQDNTKWIKRDGKDQPLCREIGFNEYTRIKDGDFAKANAYWEKTHVFWKQVRQVWDSSLADHSEIRLQDKVNGESFDETIGKLTKSASKGETLTNEKIQAALSPFLVTTPKPR